MSSKYDIESLLADMLSIMQTHLPDKISAINSEKSDAIVLAAVDNANYYNDADKQIFNISPFIYYGLVGLETETSGNKTAITCTINFEVVFDNTNNDDTLTKVLRYTRCLREVMQENFKSGKRTNILISDLIPSNAKLNDGSDYKVGGIEIKTTIAG